MIMKLPCSVFFRSFWPHSHGSSALLYLYLPEVQHCPPTEPQSCRSRSCIPDPWVSQPGCWADQPARNLRSLPCGREQWTLETVRKKKGIIHDAVSKTTKCSGMTSQHWTNTEITEMLEDLLLTFHSCGQKKITVCSLLVQIHSCFPPPLCNYSCPLPIFLVCYWQKSAVSSNQALSQKLPVSV